MYDASVPFWITVGINELPGKDYILSQVAAVDCSYLRAGLNGRDYFVGGLCGDRTSTRAAWKRKRRGEIPGRKIQTKMQIKLQLLAVQLDNLLGGGIGGCEPRFVVDICMIVQTVPGHPLDVKRSFLYVLSSRFPCFLFRTGAGVSAENVLPSRVQYTAKV